MPMALLADGWLHDALVRESFVHAAWESLAYFLGFAVYRAQRRRQGDFLPAATRWSLVAAAILGAVVGSKVLHHLAHPSRWMQLVETPYLLLAGKTIVGGLLGGWLAVEIAKRHLGIVRATGDLYVAPLLVGIAVGRIGCFQAGLVDGTCGVATSLPWAVDFGDGVMRHPTQLYEIALLGVLALVLLRPGLPRPPEGWTFRAFMTGYLLIRLVVDQWKPYERLGPLQVLQWVCLLVLVARWRDVLRAGWFLGLRRDREPALGGVP